MLLGPRDRPLRSVYWTLKVEGWSHALLNSGLQTAGDLSFGEQINVAFADFIAGRPLTSGVTRCDPPAGEGIWKLHTPDIRYFGVCIAPQNLVLLEAELKRNLVAGSVLTTKKMASRAVQHRKILGIKDWHNGDIRSAFPSAR